MIEFQQFWNEYPRKVAKRAAEKSWSRLSEKERGDAMAAIAGHVKRWSGTEREFIPHASTWLNGARWEDELDDAENIPRKALAWWATDDGVMQKGRALGVGPKPGEAAATFKARVIEAARAA